MMDLRRVENFLCDLFTLALDCYEIRSLTKIVFGFSDLDWSEDENLIKDFFYRKRVWVAQTTEDLFEIWMLMP